MNILKLADFFGDLAIVDVTAQIDSNTSTDEQGSGDLNRASYGTRMWYGSASIALAEHADVEPIIAKLQYLEEADVGFRLYPGWRFGSSVTTGTVTAVGTDRREVMLSETRPAGDIFGVEFSTGKRQMHRVVQSSGFDHTVVPALPFGVDAGDAVTFGRPEIDAVVTSVRYPTFSAVVASGLFFEWRQTY